MSKTPSILAIDQGTTGTTCLVVANDGRILGKGYEELPQYFPRPGWVEHDATEIWEVTKRVAREALESTKLADVRGVGITNQRETIVLWDRETLEPVHRAIVWQDRRTSDLCFHLKKKGHEPEVRHRTGLVLDPYFSGTKLSWLFRERPELRSRAEAGDLAAGTIDSWLITCLTQGAIHATDPTNASRTLLYDLSRATWDPWLLDLLEIPPAILPEVRPSCGDFGMTIGDALGIELPVGGVAGDQQAALFGQGCWSSGHAKNTYGTGAFLLMHTGDRIVSSNHGLLTTAACDSRGGLSFALEGSVFIAGAAVQWLRDGLGLLKDAAESEAMAARLTSNDGVYFVPAFVGLGAPHWIPEARGALFGVTRGTTKEHLVRAALEAMAFGTQEVIEAMEADSGTSMTELRVDGGAAKNDWLLKFQAGLLGVPVRRSAMVETTALGVAGLAGLSVGVWGDSEEFLASRGDTEIFESEISDGLRVRLKSGWARAVRGVKGWATDKGSIT